MDTRIFIKSVVRDTSLIGGQDRYVKVVVQMSNEYWLKLKRKGALGSLYGIDISNEVYKQHDVRALNPTVSDKERARKGVKTITLWYDDPKWLPEEDRYSNVVRVDFKNRRRAS